MPEYAKFSETARATPLVMIHGLLRPIDFFAPAARLDNISVHTPDLLGYRRYRDAAGQLTLATQAAHVAQYIKLHVNEPCYALGHSVGGAIAMLLARQEPVLVKGVISAEGNFTLNDAFWCRHIAPLDADAWAAEYAQMQRAPSDWLRKNDIEPNEERLAWADAILSNQSAAAVQSMAQAVVKETADPAFLTEVRGLLDKKIPVWLLAGEKSASGWDVPTWVRQAAHTYVTIPETGHMMMLEKPKEFCDALRSMLY